MRVYQNGALLPTPFLDITASVANSNDRGLLGVAVHPDFPHTPYVYLLFTWNPPGYSQHRDRRPRVAPDPRRGRSRAGLQRGQGGQRRSRRPSPAVPGHVILLGKNSTAANIGNPDRRARQTKASCMTGLTMAGAPIEDCIPSDEDSHSIGTVMFGIDGSLFVGSGDGSNYTERRSRARCARRT